MTIDFTEATFSADTIEVTLGFGELVVIVPDGIAVDVTGAAGVGQVTLLGRDTSGISPKDSVSEPAATLHLNVRVGFGRVEVKRG